MQPEVVAALVAGCFSIVTLLVNLLLLFIHNRQDDILQSKNLEASERRLRIEMEAQRDKWRKSFEIEVNRELVVESNLELIRQRLKVYPSVWECLRITSGHEWKSLGDTKTAVQLMTDQLSKYAYSEIGLIMNNRSRQLLLELRRAGGKYILGLIDFSDLQYWAHLLKHSLRADLGISTEEFENEFKSISNQLHIED